VDLIKLLHKRLLHTDITLSQKNNTCVSESNGNCCIIFYLLTFTVLNFSKYPVFL